MIVLDTNVVSELLRPAPAKQVEAWLSAQDGGRDNVESYLAFKRYIETHKALNDQDHKTAR